MNEKPRLTVTPLAAGASVMGICCGLPLLASAGVLGTMAGIGFGSWLIVLPAAAVAVVGFVRWRRTEDSCSIGGLDDSSSPAMHGAVLSPAQTNRTDEESR